MSVPVNVIEAKFNARERRCVAGPLWQYDYGKILKITGIALPDMYEVHFSNDPHGIAKTITGNSDGVSIPDEYLVSGASVFAWLFLHNGSNDGGTELQIEITVRRRARAVEIPPTPVEQTVITQLIADMNVALEKAEHERELSEEAANKSEESMEESQDAAELSKSYAVGGTGTRDGEDEDNAKFWSEQSKQAFEDARTQATNAENSKNAAVDSERNAKQSEEKAKISETNAGSSEANAKQSEQKAKESEKKAAQMMGEAERHKNAAKTAEDNARSHEDKARAAEESARNERAGAENAANASGGFASISQSYAVGGTGVRDGEDIDNSMYYYQQTKIAANDALNDIEIAENSVLETIQNEKDSSIGEIQAETQERVEEVDRHAAVVSGYADNAKASMTAAGESASKALSAKNGAEEAYKNAEKEKEASEEASRAAETSRQSAETANTEAGEHESNAQRYASEAAESAALAQQEAALKGWMYVEGRDDGHLYLVSENMDGITLKDVNGRLVIVYG